jgi:hypothetical protein
MAPDTLRGKNFQEQACRPEDRTITTNGRKIFLVALEANLKKLSMNLNLQADSDQAVSLAAGATKREGCSTFVMRVHWLWDQGLIQNKTL